MSVVIRRRGDDIPLLIGLTDSTGTPINITNLAQLYVYVVHATAGTILVKFNKGGTGGFTALTVISATSYRADVKSGITKTATLGEYHVDINVVETDADYESSQKNTIGIDAVFNLKDSVSKTVSSG
jgi:hypothetical protein